MLPEAPMVLTNAGTASKHEVKSDQAGRFTFTGLLPGDYDLHAQVPGFATRYRVTIRAGQILERDVTLQVGTIEETISVSDGQDGPQRTPPPVVDLPAFPEPGRCGQSPAGGCLEEPRKLRDVEPVYPPSRKDAAATVRLEGRIGTDGFVKALRLAAPADAAFANASLEAVSQWQFRPTRLNGVTVETEIKVTINFKAR
jgi:TonB family protein